jgi:hypothetical protein
MLRCHCSFLETSRKGSAMRIGTRLSLCYFRRKSSLYLYRKKSDRNVCCLGSDMHGDPSHCPRYCSSDGWCRQGLIVVTKIAKLSYFEGDLQAHACLHRRVSIVW